MESEETNSVMEFPPAPAPQPVGVYGWRKRCVYASLVFIMAIVVVNIALTVWILRVLHFSIDGMGRLKIVSKGFELDGEAEFTRPVYVETITSRADHPLYVQSEKAVELLTTNGDNNITSSIVVDSEGIEATCDIFNVKDSYGRSQFTIKNGEITLLSKDITCLGDVTFEGSLITPTLLSPKNESLNIQSTTGLINISGVGVFVSSDSAEVIFTAHHNINLTSISGGIHLNSSRLYLHNLPYPSSRSSSIHLPRPKVFQLCLCENGKMFLASPRGICAASPDICREVD